MYVCTIHYTLLWCWSFIFFRAHLCSVDEELSRARICKRLRRPGIYSARLYSLAGRYDKYDKSIPWNRSLDSLNVYKFGLWGKNPLNRRKPSRMTDFLHVHDKLGKNSTKCYNRIFRKTSIFIWQTKKLDTYSFCLPSKVRNQAIVF
jgi:hypothetical protein